MSLALLFPGQGSQSVGMGGSLAEAFPAARDVFAAVDEALGQNLFHLMQNGPESELTLTENAQPALMAVSLAVVRVLSEEFGIKVTRAAFAAGHSLGEYSALAATDALSIVETAKLLKLRGQAMQLAAPVGSGAMASLVGPKVDVTLAELAAEAGCAAGVCAVHTATPRPNPSRKKHQPLREGKAVAIIEARFGAGAVCPRGQRICVSFSCASVCYSLFLHVLLSSCVVSHCSEKRRRFLVYAVQNSWHGG